MMHMSSGTKRLGRCTLGGIEGDVVMVVLEERGE